MALSWREYRSEKGRMDSAYIRSRAVIHLGTMVFSANDLQYCSTSYSES
jgi:hypothetical protein